MPSTAQRKTGPRILPRRGNTPGLKRGRRGLPYWIAKQIVPDPMGFPEQCIPLPPGADAAELSRLCRAHTTRLDRWIEQRRAAEPEQTGTRYDGTVLAACRVYQEHPHSPFNTTIKANTRKSYLDSLKVIETTVGARLIHKVTVIDCRYWYGEWRKPAVKDGKERIDRAHNAIAMFKTVLRFNAALRRQECKQLAEELEKVRFERGGAREEEMSQAHAVAFIRAAHELAAKGAINADRAMNMALGVAAQFELAVRQKDIIGEWHHNERDSSQAIKRGAAHLRLGAEVWTGWFTWENIPGWRWRMRTSKSKYRSPLDFDLSIYGLLFPLLEAVPHDQRHGPIIKGEDNLPIRARTYQKNFRKIARAASIPDEVWSMDARAGAATEAEEAGIDMGLIQDALGHSRATTTVRYIRRRSAKIADVAAARQRSRTNDGA
jgi:hypothetical protein